MVCIKARVHVSWFARGGSSIEAWSKRPRSSTGVSEQDKLETDTVVLWAGELPRMLNIVDGMPVATKQRLRLKENVEHEDLEALAEFGCCPTLMRLI